MASHWQNSTLVSFGSWQARCIAGLNSKRTLKTTLAFGVLLNLLSIWTQGCTLTKNRFNLCFVVKGDWTQHFQHAEQVSYQWAEPPALSVDFYKRIVTTWYWNQKKPVFPVLSNWLPAQEKIFTLKLKKAQPAMMAHSWDLGTQQQGQGDQSLVYIANSRQIKTA